MSGVRTLQLDRVVDGAGARVVVELDARGTVTDARFVLDALPRVEALLRGRPVAAVPTMIERLCGICPITHHLAGVRALDALHVGSSTGAALLPTGPTPAALPATVLAPTALLAMALPPTVFTPTALTMTALAVRRLLLYADVLAAHARRLVWVDVGRALAVQAFARRVVVATAGASHFPRCAVPGGVVAAVAVADRDALAETADAIVAQSSALVTQLEAQTGRIGSPTFRGPTVSGPTFGGHDVALVDSTGALDLYGAMLRAVSADGTVLVDGATPAQWTDVVGESRPGRTACRPYLRAVGADRGGYRVGPVAQLRAATALSTPAAEAARVRWAAGAGEAQWAVAVLALHCAEVVRDLLGRPELVVGPLLPAPVAVPGSGSGSSPGSGSGSGSGSTSGLGVVSTAPSASSSGQESTVTGWVDAQRGLLVHTYRVSAAGELMDATITTPTAQNEGWLATLLRASALEHHLGADSTSPPRGLAVAMEAAVRAADPCLPCTALPPGRMGLDLTVIDSHGHTVAQWNLDQPPSAITDPGDGVPAGTV